MSLLKEIQEASIDASVGVSVVLRKCLVLAARLGNANFENWVDAELNGYQSKDDLPAYRVLRVNSKGDFSGFAGSGLKNADIPMGCLPEEYRDAFSHSYLMGPISEYEALVHSSKTDSLREPWLPDFVAHVGEDIWTDLNCMQAWKVVPYPSIVGLVEAVRNKILRFVIEVEKEAPDAGEPTGASAPLPEERVAHVFNTYVSGNVHNIAAGSTDFTQTGEFNVLSHDFDSLASYLKNNGISEDDTHALREAILHDKEDDPAETQIGGRVGSWIAGMLNKAAKGSLEIGTSIAATILTKAVNSYYGQ